jgi:hypothetical protein
MAVEIPSTETGSVAPETPKKSGDETESGSDRGTPELMSSGTYAIYKTPEGGWHIAYIPSDIEETQHFEIPAIAVRLFQQMQRGEGLPSPAQMVRQMLEARKQS